MAFGNRTDGVAALEVGPSGLRLVEYLPAENRVASAGVYSLDPVRWRDPEHLAAGLRAVSGFSRKEGARRLIASVPLRHAFLRVLKLPQGTGDASDALRWEMEQYFARPLELYAVDYQRLRDSVQDGSQRYLAAAYRLSEVDALRAAIEASPAPPLAALDVDALAVVNAFAFNYPEFLEERTVLVKADLHATVCIRTREGEYLGASLHRTAPAPLRSGDTQDRAEDLKHRVESITHCLQAAVREWGDPDHVLFCGDLCGEADFRNLLKARLPALALLNPYRNLQGPDPDRHPFAHPGASFAAAVGMALRLAGED